ncbi:MAG TPA: sensor domain-containing diguanylate cyclase, partial [Nocardioides sp.]|nr:sensor domain-containing diguanylate cyclase [Nocardioides sp.]
APLTQRGRSTLDEAGGDHESGLTDEQLSWSSPAPDSAEHVAHAQRALHVVPAVTDPRADDAVQRAIEAIPQPGLVVAFDGTILSVNAASSEWTRLGEAELVGRALTEPLDGADAANVLHALSAMAAGELENLDVVASMATSLGMASNVTLTLAVVRDDANVPSCAIALLRDESGHERDKADLRHRASHDGLTELPNRATFLERLVQALARARRQASWTAVLFIDLDGFKEVNDTQGHSAGDELLFSSAGRISRVMRPEDTLARYGGDEFTVLCEDLHDADEAHAIAQRILDVLDAPFVLSAGTMSLTASIGVAVTAGGKSDPAGVIADADAAMYASKQAGGGRYTVLDVTVAASGVGRSS